ncbi:MAG: glycosyltransferase family 2 protein [Sedimentitalea sp.]
MGENPLISIVTPVYGCRDCVEALTDEVRKAFEDTDLDWELILVDDRSPDKPWSMIQKLAAEDQRVLGVRLSKNHGQHLAIWAGLEQAKGDWVAVIDCDLQDDPTIIPALYEKAMTEPVDAVVVDRGEWKDTWFRRFASRMFYKTMDVLAGIRLNNNVGNFGLYSRRMVKTLLTFQEKEVFLPVMVTLTGLPRVSYSMDRDGRHAGQSAYSLKRLLQLAIAIIIRFSDRPLKLSIIAGMVFSTFSAVFSVLLLIAWATGAFTVPGWTSLILSVWFLAGLILAVLGIHGFYMGRIFAEVKNRPRIMVETTTEPDAPT